VGHRHYWFFQDEWVFLVDRDGGSLDDLLRPHNEHWSTVPILVYRVLWRVFGLNTYVPYQGLVIALHLTAAVLLRVVMRRAGAGPWMSTAAASMFLLLGGAGWQNIVWAFQIGFVGSLVCGLAHLLLADHDGPSDRRDALGLTFAVLGLMCSGVAVTMVFIVGLAVLIRRGWRLAILHTAPPAAIFLAWWLGFGRSAYQGSEASIGSVAQFVQHGLRNAVARMAEDPAVELALVVILVVGLVLAWTPLGRVERRRQAAMPAAMLAGAVVFMAIAATGRAGEYGIEFAERWRYVHLLAALLAPALAVAAGAVARRWRVATPPLIVLFLAGVPEHVDSLWPDRFVRDPLALTGAQVVGEPRLFLAVAHSPYLDQLPPELHPFHGAGSRLITVGWMRDALASGRIPDDEPSPRSAAEAEIYLTLTKSPIALDQDACVPFKQRTQRMDAGDFIDYKGPLLVEFVGKEGARSPTLPFPGQGGSRLEAVVGPITVTLTPYPGVVPVVEC
jgi:hypothetical protein